MRWGCLHALVKWPLLLVQHAWRELLPSLLSEMTGCLEQDKVTPRNGGIVPSNIVNRDVKVSFYLLLAKSIVVGENPHYAQNPSMSVMACLRQVNSEAIS